MSITVSQEAGKVFTTRRLVDQMDEYVQQAARQGKPLDEVERTLFDSVLKIGFAATEQFLQLQGNGDLGETVQTADGRTLQRSAEPIERPLRTVFGQHTLRAYGYAPGPHKKIELRPVDARLALPPGDFSYLFEQFSQYFCVDQAFGQAARGIQMVLRQQVSVNSLEGINRRVGQQAGQFLDQLPTPPAAQEGELLLFTGDCKGVPLVHEEAQQVPVFQQELERPGNRRMATLAGVYSVDRHVRTPQQIVAALFRDESVAQPQDRPQPQFKHVVACFARQYEDGEETLEVSGTTEAFSWAAVQVEARRRPGQRLIRLMDGQESLWEAADACLAVPAEETVDILDLMHVSSHVWRAAKVLYQQQERREAFVRDRLLRILQGEGRGVVSGLRRMASTWKLSRAERAEIRKVSRYLESNLYRMRYDEYLRAGYPIATGVIEGACRHLVKDRMERSGMRWRLAGAQPMLNMRAVYQSSYWDQFHKIRIAEEQDLIHPHRHLLAGYVPKPLAA